MRKIEFECPCCKKVQIILFDEDTGKITGVLFNDKDSNKISDSKLMESYNICLGESEVNNG